MQEQRDKQLTVIEDKLPWYEVVLRKLRKIFDADKTNASTVKNVGEKVGIVEQTVNKIKEIKDRIAKRNERKGKIVEQENKLKQDIKIVKDQPKKGIRGRLSARRRIKEDRNQLKWLKDTKKEIENNIASDKRKTSSFRATLKRADKILGKAATLIDNTYEGPFFKYNKFQRAVNNLKRIGVEIPEDMQNVIDQIKKECASHLVFDEKLSATEQFKIPKNLDDITKIINNYARRIEKARRKINKYSDKHKILLDKKGVLRLTYVRIKEERAEKALGNYQDKYTEKLNKKAKLNMKNTKAGNKQSDKDKDEEIEIA